MSLTLRQICFVANELQPVLDDLKAVLGIEVCFVDEGVGVFGLENSLLPVGTNFIEVVAPVKEGTAAGRYLERRDGNLVYALASYNAGPGNCNKWKRRWPNASMETFVDNIPFSETKGYVKKVLGNYAAYKSLYGSK